jgi:hypothetical protein
MHKSIQTLFFFILATFVATSCVKRNWDEPPVNVIPVGNILTIQDLKDTFAGQPIRFDDDFSVFGIITADDRSGNLFRNFYLQDETGGILIRTQFSGGLIEGDSVRVYLKGVTLTQFAGMIQLDSVNVDRNVIKQATQRVVLPQTVTVTQALNDETLLAKLVRFENVEFASSDLGQTFANAAGLQAQNRNLVDCNGNTIIVRTSGFANFANDVVPSGNGSLIAILGVFNGTRQLYIRRVSELNMTGERCTGGPVTCDPVTSISEDFSSAVNNVDFSLGCWSNIATVGSRVWRGRLGTDANGLCVQANSFGSGQINETWLISPPVQANGTNTLSFQTQVSFWTHIGLTVLISTNYDGSNPNAATWTTIPATIAGQSSGSSWVSSGTIQLFGFMPQAYSGAFHIGFRYNGNALTEETGTYRIDNVVIN